MGIRRVLILVSIVACLGSSTVSAQRGGGGGRGRGNPGLSDAQRKAIDSILALANDAAAGRPVPNDLSLAWIHDDLIRVQQQGQALVPFMFTLDQAKVAAGPISIYWRVVSKDAPPMPEPPANGKKDDKKAPPAPTYAYEALTQATVNAGEPIKMSRSFAVAAGSYDVYLVVKEGSPTADPKKAPKGAPTPKVAVIKQAITVPDLWNGDLSTSSLLIAEKINNLSAPLSAQESVSRPYALGQAELVPFTTTKFTKKDKLTAFLLIYNAKGDGANRPDVKVEFNFYSIQGGGEKFFNATPVTNLNAQTLPPQVMASSQLQAGFQDAPLESFPEGNYRLEVKVTDNVAKKEVTRELKFSVSGS